MYFTVTILDTCFPKRRDCARVGIRTKYWEYVEAEDKCVQKWDCLQDRFIVHYTNEECIENCKAHVIAIASQTDTASTLKSPGLSFMLMVLIVLFRSYTCFSPV